MDWYQILGYVASVIVVISMMMRSIKVLRWVNMIGAGFFATYGFLINALPVGFLNLFIVFIDIYYLIQAQVRKEYFKVLNTNSENEYLVQFLDYYKDDIKKYYPNFDFKQQNCQYIFFVLQNMSVAGVVLAKEYKNGVLEIVLDYTSPQYRDFKVGRYLYNVYIDKFNQAGYRELINFSSNKKTEKYLKKMGFDEIAIDNKKCFSKKITESV